MKVKIKKLSDDAVIPSYSKIGDAGLDMTATSRVVDEYGNFTYGTGLAVEIPEGYVGLLFPRSSICKQNQYLTNSVGVLDSNYRGEVKFKFKFGIGLQYDLDTPFEKYRMVMPYNLYEVGDRIGQLIIMPYPNIEFEEVDELSSTNRGEGGFGSTGK